VNIHLALVVAVAACTLAAGCMSYSSTTRTVPAPAPTQSTVYTDTTIVPGTTTVYTTR
jgi:hypothetical protein